MKIFVLSADSSSTLSICRKKFWLPGSLIFQPQPHFSLLTSGSLKGTVIAPRLLAAESNNHSAA